LSQQRLALQAELEEMQSQWTDFRRSTIREQRQRAMGKTFEVLQSSSGRTFNDVRVSVIDDGGVTIRHADGSARLGFEDLDARQRAFFGLEADLSLAAAEKESRDAAAYERWVEAGLAQNEAKSQRASEIAMREAADARRKQTALLGRQLAAANERPLAQVATSVGNRSWSSSRYSSSYQTYRPTYRYVYYYNVPAYSAASRFPTNVCGPSVRVPSPRVPYVRPKEATPR